LPVKIDPRFTANFRFLAFGNTVILDSPCS